MILRGSLSSRLPTSAQRPHSRIRSLPHLPLGWIFLSRRSDQADTRARERETFITELGKLRADTLFSRSDPRAHGSLRDACRLPSRLQKH